MDTPVTPRRGHDGRYHYLYENLGDGYRGSGAWILDHPAPGRLVTEWTEFFESEKEAYAAEARWLILDLIDEDLLCRNIGEGGSGGTSETFRRILARSEIRAKRSAALKAAWAPPEVRARRAATTREALNRPEVRAIISENTKASPCAPRCPGQISSRNCSTRKTGEGHQGNVGPSGNQGKAS